MHLISVRLQTEVLFLSVCVPSPQFVCVQIVLPETPIFRLEGAPHSRCVRACVCRVCACVIRVHQLALIGGSRACLHIRAAVPPPCRTGCCPPDASAAAVHTHTRKHAHKHANRLPADLLAPPPCVCVCSGTGQLQCKAFINCSCRTAHLSVH